MNFNYRDFFIHNDDLHIIKEQLSIVDEIGVSKKDAFRSNAKAVWDMYQIESNEQKIADKLEINVETVKKIIQICLMNTVEDKNPQRISAELNMAGTTVVNILNQALGSERERYKDKHFISDAEKIYNLHKDGKTKDEIVDLVNKEKKSILKKIDTEKVDLVLDIVNIAKKQMEVSDGKVNLSQIHREIGEKITTVTILNLLKILNLGKPRYVHRFTEEQDAFILYLYLQRNGTTEIARKFNEKFKDSEGNALNILQSSIGSRLKDFILKPKGESEISEYVLDLLNKYKSKYFPTVDINVPETKELLTHYIPLKTIKGKDTTGTGTNRDMSAHLGTLPKNFNTMITNLVR